MAEIEHVTLEVGNTSEFDSVSGSPTVNNASAMVGNYGLEINSAEYGRLNLSIGASEMRMRFYFKWNMTFSSGGAGYCLNIRGDESTYYTLFFITFDNSGGTYRWFAIFTDDDDTNSTYSLGNNPDTNAHYIEIYMKRETSNGANNGVARVWLDGVLKGENTSFGNYGSFNTISWLCFGTRNSLPSGWSGSFYLDDLVIRNDNTEIGPATSPSTVSLDALGLAAGIPDIDPVGGAVTISLNVLGLAAGIPDIDPAGGAVTISLNVLGLAAGIPDIDPAGGAVTVSLDVLGLAAGIADISAIIDQSILLDALGLSSDIYDIDAAIGAVIVSLDTLGVAAGVDDISPAPGDVVIGLDTLSLASNLSDIWIIGGDIAIDLDTLSAISGIQSISVAVYTTIALDTLDISSGVDSVNVGVSAVVVGLNALSIASMTHALFVSNSSQPETHTGGGGGSYSREHVSARNLRKRDEFNLKESVINKLSDATGFERIVIAEVLESWLISVIKTSTSRLLQNACAVEFPEKCSLIATVPLIDKRNAFESAPNRLRRSLVRDDFTDAMEAARHLLRVIYALTQRVLSNQNIDALTVYRTYRLSHGDLDGLTTGQQDGDADIYIRTLPLSSWSTDSGIPYGLLGDNDVLLMSSVPAENIFSLPITGIGSMRDKEIIVFGGYPQKARISWE